MDSAQSIMLRKHNFMKSIKTRLPILVEASSKGSSIPAGNNDSLDVELNVSSSKNIMNSSF